MFREGRINYFAPADYREGKTLHRIMKKVIDLVAAREDLWQEEAALREVADSPREDIKQE